MVFGWTEAGPTTQPPDGLKVQAAATTVDRDKRRAACQTCQYYEHVDSFETCDLIDWEEVNCVGKRTKQEERTPACYRTKQEIFAKLLNRGGHKNDTCPWNELNINGRRGS